MDQRLARRVHFAAVVNVATSAPVAPFPNANKTGAAGTSVLLTLPSRSLVGFLSLLNGLLSPTVENEPTATAPPSTRLRAADAPQRRSGETEKGEKSSPEPKTESSASARAIPLPAGPQSSAVPAFAAPRPAIGLSAPAFAVASQIPSFAGFPQISPETTRSNMTVPETALAAQPPSSEPVNKFATGLAFALRLTPQTIPIDSTPVAMPHTKAQVAAAPTARISTGSGVSSPAQPSLLPGFGRADQTREDPIQVLNSQRPASPAPSPPPSSGQSSTNSPQQASRIPTPAGPPWPPADSGAHSGPQERNVEPVPHLEKPQHRLEPQVSPGSFVAASASNEIDSASHILEPIDVLKPAAQSPQGVSPSDPLPKIVAAQPMMETPETSAPSATDKEQPRFASQVESGTPRVATRNKTSTEQGNTYVKSHVGFPNQKGNSQGEEMNDAGARAKSAKPDIPEKSAPNPQNFHVQEGTGLLSVFTGAANGANRIAPRSETLPVDPQAAGRVSTEIETNPSVRPQPIREISLRLADKGSNPVDIQMVERAGHVQVAVRTPDHELTKSLQTNLGELVERLEQKGYKTETWVPGAPLHTTAALTESASSSGHNQDQPGHSGSWDGGQQQRQGQHESGRRQQARWMTQVQQTLNEEDSDTEGIPMEDR